MNQTTTSISTDAAALNAALLQAVKDGDLAASERLIAAGADVNRAFSGVCDWENVTLLHVAAADGNGPLCRLLLAHGAHITALMHNDKDTTWDVPIGPLIAAVIHKQSTTTQLLIDASSKSDVMHTMDRLLEVALFDEFRFVVQNHSEPRLLELTRDLGFMKKTMQRNTEDVCLHLIGHGHGDAWSEEMKCALLHESVVHLEDPCVCEALIKKGISINIVDAQGKNALHHAAERSSFALCAFLIESGIDLHVKDIEGETALHKVYNSSSLDQTESRESIALWLLAHGADSGHAPKGMRHLTALQAAVTASMTSRMVELLHRGPSSLEGDDLDSLVVLAKTIESKETLAALQAHQAMSAIDGLVQASNAPRPQRNI